MGQDLDQFIRFELGQGKVILDGQEHDVENDWAAVMPAGLDHNLINTSDIKNRKLYSIYSPPEHLEGKVHPTKVDDAGHDH
jgi:mannose-6-phosphate isomerase-like protein (cupin superfamily)